ncbi:DUF6286 domain-containing protein [Streptomyces kaempferi]
MAHPHHRGDDHPPGGRPLAAGHGCRRGRPRPVAAHPRPDARSAPLLPLRAPEDSPETGAWLDRKGAAIVLRDAAMRVPGVSRARIRVRRRRVIARVEVGFRDIATVRDDLSQALQRQCRQLALVHTPRLAIRLHHHTR